jgi:hypothetical protein
MPLNPTESAKALASIRQIDDPAKPAKKGQSQEVPNPSP